VGWVSHGAINYISTRLSLGPAEAYGVATFYDLIATEPTPPRVAFVCDDIACVARDSDEVIRDLTETLGESGVDHGGVMWKRSPCLGQCEKGSAAFVHVAGGAHRVVAPANAERVIEILRATEPQDAAVRHRIPQDDGTPLRLLGNLDVGADLEAYRSRGGYTGLEKAITIGPAAIRAEVAESGIRGRGGAAFPAGVKWNAVAAHRGQKYVVCNADESEPGTFKDRVLMEGDPFAVVEGLTIAGIATGATKGFFYIRGEYPVAIRTVEAAIAAARDAKLLGDDILGTGQVFDIEVRRGAGAYICGEETALFNSIEGFRGEPRQKPPFPTDVGLFGRPTLVNNVETLANIPLIVADGGAAYAAIGTVESTGPKVFCVSGNVGRPGVYEAAFGASTRELIDMAGGVEGTVQAVLVGGAAGSFVGDDKLDVPLTFEDTRPQGMTVGSGVVLVFNDTVDLVRITLRIAEFFAEESCGLCVPCRVGTVRQHESLVRLASGDDTAGELSILGELDQVLRDASICGLGQAASLAVQSALGLDLLRSDT
jgi:NADH-quinone oxidoreductase subunit F